VNTENADEVIKTIIMDDWLYITRLIPRVDRTTYILYLSRSRSKPLQNYLSRSKLVKIYVKINSKMTRTRPNDVTSMVLATVCVPNSGMWVRKVSDS